MIRTTLRCRISGELSFPLGAKQISEALEGVAQYDDLTVAFYRHWRETPARIKAMLDHGEPLRVLAAEYRNVRPGRCGSQELINRGWYEETWKLAVYPVPRDRRAATRALLLSTGLPKIRTWLEAVRPDTWRSGYHHCHILVRSAEEGTLQCEQQ